MTAKNTIPSTSEASFVAAATHGDVTISLVIAMYRVSTYLPDFLASLDEQNLDGVSLECIFVDDGSPENEAELASTWLERTGTRGRVIRKNNGGVSSARNAGIEAATGEWISFPDPDDMLSPGYLHEIAKFASTGEGADADVIAAKVEFYFEASGTRSDSHPLSFKFDGPPRNLSLIGTPHAIQMSAASSFIRRSTLTDNALYFDERLRVAEDAVFLARVFAQSSRPQLGVVRTAVYSYRKRAASNSAIDGSGRDPSALLARYSVGFLPLVRELRSKHRLEEWLAHFVLYDLAWFFRAERGVRAISLRMSDEENRQFLEDIRELLGHFERPWIHTAIKPSVAPEIRWFWDVLHREGREEPIATVVAPPQLTELDSRRNWLQIRYFATTEAPNEVLYVGGKSVAVTHAKTRRINLFGQSSMYERIIWVRATSWIRLEVDRQLQALTYGDSLPKYSAFRADYVAKLAGTNGKRPLRETRRAVVALPTFAPKRLRHAWVFLDRVDLAQDNAEHLYRYVTRHYAQINAWYVLRRESPDWERLRREKFRLVQPGSALHRKLLLNAAHVLSSHADAQVTDPLPRSAYPEGKRPWRFTFLQHGVIMNDLSRWLNFKAIDTFVTSTHGEYQSIVSNGTPYVFTTLETKLTGLPRHDALKAKAASLDDARDRRILLIAPTWRDGLLKESTLDRRRGPIDDVELSDYVQNWRHLLTMPQLKTLSEAHDLQIVFIVHPQARAITDYLHIPDWIRTWNYSDGDLQELIARTRLHITDYSSLSFEAAFVGAPTVYFQFDRGSVFGGAHTFSPGYYDYHKDGFGPVCETPEGTLQSASGLLDVWRTSRSWPKQYHDRIDGSFAFRDTHASERVVRAVLASDPRAVPPIGRKRFARVRRALRPVHRFMVAKLGRGARRR